MSRTLTYATARGQAHAESRCQHIRQFDGTARLCAAVLLKAVEDKRAAEANGDDSNANEIQQFLANGDNPFAAYLDLHLFDEVPA